MTKIKSLFKCLVDYKPMTVIVQLSIDLSLLVAMQSAM